MTRLDPREKEAELAPGGRILRYDRLLLATGASARGLEVPGFDLGRVYRLRSLADAKGLRAAARAASRAVVIGTGWVGTEVAASLRRLGLEVALVGRSAVPFQRTLGVDVGRVFAAVHADHGVELHLGVQVTSLAGRRRVEEVRLADGRALPCDLVVAGLGAPPRTELAEAAGLAVADGILTDSHLETGVPGVFAAGDVANLPHPVLGARLRVEHWWGALTEGPVAAANLLGHRAVYGWVPTFTSRQHDMLVEHTGHAAAWDQVVVRGDLDQRSFVALWMRRGRVLAGMNANTPGAARHIQAMVTTGRRIDPELLVDPRVDLGALAPPGSAGRPAEESTDHRRATERSTHE
ncbi:MAG: NAD(P)/FAD-dependent oxidoreductase [Acidimicrobiales bacterium]